MTSTHIHTLYGGGVVIDFSTDPDYPNIMAEVSVQGNDGNQHEALVLLDKYEATALRNALDAAIQKGLVR